jgi:polyhydroxyalkanoate synthesis regulator phasin
MNENLLNTLYFLLGAKSLGEKKVKEFVEEIILNSEFTTEEGERIYREISIEFEKLKEHRTSQFYSFVDDFLSALNLPERSLFQEKMDEFYNEFAKNSDKFSSMFKNKNNKLTVVKK